MSLLVALYIIGVTFTLLFLAIRLGMAQDEIARLRGQREQRSQDEYLAYKQALMMSVACLLAGLAAASWHTQSRRESWK
jgi:Na+/alanine symporter